MIARGGWTLRQRVVALCVIVGIVIAGLAVAEALVAAENRSATDTILTKSGPLRVQGEQLLNALVNQETGVRGYAVTGAQNELGPYNSGLQQERDTVAAMTSLLADRPDIRAQLATVEQKAAAWRAAVAGPTIEATRNGGPAAGQAVLTDQARQQFDDLRGSVAQVQQSILVIRQQGGLQADRTSKALVILMIIAAVVVLLAGIALLMSLDRLVIGPVTALAGQVRSVAEGDYGRDIEKVGPPELAQLAGDIDAMRRRIAADLAEVRAARTSIEEINDQLQKQAEELVRSNRDLEQFAYVASHDLQEPLRKVASFCQLLQRRYAGQLDERADQYIAFAVDGAQRMQRLINDLLAFSRIGRLTSGFTEVDLNKVLGDVAAQTEAARQYAEGELTWSQLPVIRGEEPLLTNLIANLVNNSIKFRRPDVPPKVHVSAQRVGDEWEITCQDNGIGIEAEFADKIFVIFQRLHSKDAYPGTGIGLAIAKKIVEYHGGRVWVDTDVSEGTAIRFTLPVLPAQDEQDETQQDETQQDETQQDETAPEGDATPGEAMPVDAMPVDAMPDEAARSVPDGEGDDGGGGSRGTGDRTPSGAPAGETDGMKETVA